MALGALYPAPHKSIRSPCSRSAWHDWHMMNRQYGRAEVCVDCPIQSANLRTCTSVQARSACLAFPYMVDAQLFAEAVTDASMGGEDAFSAWTAQQMDDMRAVHPASLHGRRDSGKVEPTGAAADVTGRMPNEGAGCSLKAKDDAAAATPSHADAAAPAEAAAPDQRPPSERDVTQAVAGAPLTLSQLAARHVGDILGQAGMRTPRHAAARPVEPFGRLIRV